MVLVALVPSVLAVVGDSWVRLGSLVAQLVLAASGVLLWPDPEHRRHAGLLLAASAAVGMSNLDSRPFELGYWIEVGLWVQWVPAALLLPVLVEHPEPAGARSAEGGVRWLIAGMWVWAIGLPLVRVLTWDPAFNGYEGPAEWFSVYPSLPFHEAVSYAWLGLLAVLASWFTVVCVRRWRGASGTMRGTVRLVSGAGILLALGLVLRVIAPYAVRFGLLTRDRLDTLDLAHNVLLALVPLALLLVGLRSAARRGAVVERLLSAAGDPDAVQEVLRHELDDPTLRLTFVEREATLEGHETGAPASKPGRVTRTLAARDGATAVIDADARVALDPVGLRLVLAATAVVLANTRLTAERAAHLAELEASRTRIVEAGEARRRDLERDLHDGAQQHLLTVATTISRARLATGTEQLDSTLDEARSQLSAAMEELRRLARGIHPAVLSQAGLVPALEALTAGGDAELVAGPGLNVDGQLPQAVESTAYFVVAEAVTNARKHSAGRIRVEVDRDDQALRASVSDDGGGGARVGPAGGLRGLVDRAQALGGTLDVSSPPGQGTTVRLELPVTRGHSR